jgi:hypothetical protein
MNASTTGRVVADDIISPIFIHTFSLSIAASGSSDSKPFKNVTDGDLVVTVPRIVARTPAKMVVESDTDRDLLTIEIKTTNGDSFQTNPIDIFHYEHLADNARWGGFRLPAGAEMTVKVAHTALTGGAKFTTFPIAIDVQFAGMKVKPRG